MKIDPSQSHISRMSNHRTEVFKAVRPSSFRLAMAVIIAAMATLATADILASPSASVEVQIRTDNRPIITDEAENQISALRIVTRDIAAPTFSGTERVEALARANSTFGILSTNAQYFRTRTGDHVGSALGGDSYAVARFVDTITVTPTDPGLLGQEFRIVFDLNLSGRNSIADFDGDSNSRWDASSSLTLRTGSFNGPLVGSLDSSATVRVLSNGNLTTSSKTFDGSKQGTFTWRAIYGQPLEIWGRLESYARVNRTSASQFTLGSASSDFGSTGFIAFSGASDLNGNLLPADSYTFSSESGTTYAVIPEPSVTALFLVFAAFAAVGLIYRRSCSRQGREGL